MGTRSGGRIARWAPRVAAAFAALVAMYLAILFFPAPLFAYRGRYDGYRVYSDEPLPGDLGTVVRNLDRRVHAMEHEPPDAEQRIYLCSAGKYAVFAFLLRKNPETLATGLSVANASFVSVERVREFAERNGGVLRHTRFEGDLAEVVAHEIAHFNSVRELGFRAHLGLPVWKSEGWAEYQANLAQIRADPDYDLRARIDKLLDGSYWGGRHGVARMLWESQLLVEYLGEIEGYELADLVREEVTLERTRRRMMAWRRSAPIPG